MQHGEAQGIPQSDRSAWSRWLEPGSIGPSPATNVHDYMVLAYFVGGSAVIEQAGQYEARAGDAYLIPAGERHGLVASHSPEVWGVGFNPACYAATDLAELLRPFERAAAGGSKVVRIPGSRQSHLADLCRELARESDTSAASLHADTVTKSLLALILSEVARAETPREVRQAGLAGDALRFIERACLGPLSLSDVAAAVHRSPSHVSTVVRRDTGKSVTAWITAGRMAEARRRLLHTDELIDIIGERVGYADPTHFIRMFRRAHDCTPAAWRAQHRRVAQPMTSSAVSS